MENKKNAISVRLTFFGAAPFFLKKIPKCKNEKASGVGVSFSALGPSPLSASLRSLSL
jgi:hypothetical protein